MFTTVRLRTEVFWGIQPSSADIFTEIRVIDYLSAKLTGTLRAMWLYECVISRQVSGML